MNNLVVVFVMMAVGATLVVLARRAMRSKITKMIVNQNDPSANIEGMIHSAEEQVTREHGSGPVHFKVTTNIQGNVKLPGEVKYKELSDFDLSEQGRKFFEDLDAQMASLNFSPVKTFTLLGYAHASESRIYSGGDQGINLMASFVAPTGIKGMTVFEFSSRFTDGSVLLTSNMAAQGQLLPPPDYETVSRFPGVNDSAELLKHHAKAVDKKKAANLAPVYIGPEEAMDEMQKSTKRRMEDAVAKGLLTFNQMDNTYSPTAKLFLNAPIKPHVSVKFKVNKKE